MFDLYLRNKIRNLWIQCHRLHKTMLRTKHWNTGGMPNRLYKTLLQKINPKGSPWLRTKWTRQSTSTATISLVLHEPHQPVFFRNGCSDDDIGVHTIVCETSHDFYLLSSVVKHVGEWGLFLSIFHFLPIFLAISTGFLAVFARLPLLVNRRNNPHKFILLFIFVCILERIF